MKRIHLLACTPLLAALGCGTTMTGHVTESGTTTPVSGAMVQIGEETTYTDREGRYELEVEDEETHSVYISAPAYKAHTQELAVRDQDELAMSFELTPQEKAPEPQQQAQQPAGKTEVTLNANSEASAGEDRDAGEGTLPASTPRTVQHHGFVQSLTYNANADQPRRFMLELPTQEIIQVRMENSDFSTETVKVGNQVEVTGHFEKIDGERVFIATTVKPY